MLYCGLNTFHFLCLIFLTSFQSPLHKLSSQHFSKPSFTSYKATIPPTHPPTTMSTPSDMRELLAKTIKPQTYLDISYIKASLEILDMVHKESDVERFTGYLLNRYYPDEEHWSKVPQFLVPEIRRPDRVVEKYMEDSGTFVPKIYVELKSQKGDSLEKALKQSTSSLPQLVDNVEEDFAMFLIILKGHYIAFFEYHNDRSNLVEDGVPSYSGAVPFNHAPGYCRVNIPQRPRYRGVSYLDLGFDEGDANVRMEGIFLDLLREDVTVQRVLNWMKDHRPLDVAPPLRIMRISWI